MAERDERGVVWIGEGADGGFEGITQGAAKYYGECSGVLAVAVGVIRTQKRDAPTCVPLRAPWRAHNKDAFDAPQVGARSNCALLCPRNFQGFGVGSSRSYAKGMCVVGKWIRARSGLTKLAAARSQRGRHYAITAVRRELNFAMEPA